VAQKHSLQVQGGPKSKLNSAKLSISCTKIVLQSQLDVLFGQIKVAQQLYIMS